MPGHRLHTAAQPRQSRSLAVARGAACTRPRCECVCGQAPARPSRQAADAGRRRHTRGVIRRRTHNESYGFVATNGVPEVTADESGMSALHRCAMQGSSWRCLSVGDGLSLRLLRGCVLRRRPSRLARRTPLEIVIISHQAWARRAAGAKDPCVLSNQLNSPLGWGLAVY